MTHDDRLSNIETVQNDILQGLNELKMSIMGSSKIGVEGLVSKVERHSEYIEKDKRHKWMIAGAVSVLTFLFGLFIAVYEKILK